MEDELIYQEALKYYLGVFRDKNVLHALSLMRMVAQKGNLKAINLIARCTLLIYRIMISG